MIEVDDISRPLPRYRKLIRPNRSLSLKAMVVLFLSYVLVVMVIGLGLLIAGAWVILPFMGLELIVLGVVFCLVARHARDYELLILDEQFFKIIRRQGKRETKIEFQRYWARVSFAQGSDEWHPSRLLIASHGRTVEIGIGMNNAARAMLARDLKKVMR